MPPWAILGDIGQCHHRIFKGFKSLVHLELEETGFTYAKGRELYCHTCFLTRKESC